GARHASTDVLLPGVGATGDARGTDPMWFDPARWNENLRPHLSLSDQLETLHTTGLTILSNMSALCFLVFILAIAAAHARRRSWELAWPLYLACAAGVLGYAMVLVTSRYIMPFVLAPTLTLLATLPR